MMDDNADEAILNAALASMCTKKTWSWDIDLTRRHRIGLVYPEDPELDLRILDDLEYCGVDYRTAKNSSGRFIPMCSFSDAYKLILADTRLMVSRIPHKYIEYDDGDFGIEIDINSVINPRKLTVGYEIQNYYPMEVFMNREEKFINYAALMQLPFDGIGELDNHTLLQLGPFLRISFMRGWFDDCDEKTIGIIYDKLKIK